MELKRYLVFYVKKTLCHLPGPVFELIYTLLSFDNLLLVGYLDVMVNKLISLLNQLRLSGEFDPLVTVKRKKMRQRYFRTDWN